MDNKINIKIKKSFGFTILIISGIIGIGFLLGMLSPLWKEDKSPDYHSGDFVSDKELTIDGEFTNSENKTYKIGNDIDESLLFIYDTGNNRNPFVFKSGDEFIEDVTNETSEIKNYAFVISNFSITVEIDKGKEKYRIIDYDLETRNINNEYEDGSLIISDWEEKTINNNTSDYQEKSYRNFDISVDTDNKDINVTKSEEINEQFTLSLDGNDIDSVSFIATDF